MKSLIPALMIVSLSGTGCDRASSEPEASLEPIAGKFAFAPELCADSEGVTISELGFVDHHNTLMWSELKFAHVSLWWLEKEEAARELAYTAIAPQLKNRTVVSVFIVVSDEQLEKSGIKDHPSASRPIVAYAAFETDADFDMDELKNRIRKPDESGLLYPCE